MLIKTGIQNSQRPRGVWGYSFCFSSCQDSCIVVLYNCIVIDGFKKIFNNVLVKFLAFGCINYNKEKIKEKSTIVLKSNIFASLVLCCIVGSRSHPWIQLQRKAIRPRVNSSQVSLSAMLTSTRSQYELGGFPYPLGLENNSTGKVSKETYAHVKWRVCIIWTFYQTNFFFHFQL